MKTNKLSKQGVIIGSFAIALSCVSIFSESLELWVNLHTDYLDLKRNFINLGIYAAATLVSIMLVIGVIKRHLALMAPWLIAAFTGVAFSFYFVMFNLLTVPFGHLDILSFSLVIAGLETVILYPLCSLFCEIWHEKSKGKKQFLQDSSSNCNKNKQFDFVDQASKGVV